MTAQPSIRHRSEAGKQQVRQRLLDAATFLFLQGGYDSFSLRKVAERAGFTPGNVYRYFDHKDDLLYSAVEDGFVQFGDYLEKALASTADPYGRVLALSRAYLHFAHEHPRHYELLFVRRTDELFTTRPVPGLDKLALVGQAVGEAMTAGVIRQGDVEATTDGIWALLHGAVSLSLAMPFFDEVRSARLQKEVFEMLEQILHLD